MFRFVRDAILTLRIGHHYSPSQTRDEIAEKSSKTVPLGAPLFSITYGSFSSAGSNRASGQSSRLDPYLHAGSHARSTTCDDGRALPVAGD
jgi:hypothetical protein